VKTRLKSVNRNYKDIAKVKVDYFSGSRGRTALFAMHASSSTALKFSSVHFAVSEPVTLLQACCVLINTEIELSFTQTRSTLVIRPVNVKAKPRY